MSDSTVSNLLRYAVGFGLGAFTGWFLFSPKPSSTYMPATALGISEVQLKVSDIYIQSGTTITITATVLSNSKPVQGMPVEFYDNGVLGGTSSTSSTGEAVMELTLKNPGIYNLYAESMDMKSNYVQVVVS